MLPDTSSAITPDPVELLNAVIRHVKYLERKDTPFQALKPGLPDEMFC